MQAPANDSAGMRHDQRVKSASMGRVTNTDGRVIVSRLRVAQTAWQRFRGLMFDTSLQPGEALLIPQCNAIHCAFMRLSIDVLFLSDAGDVVRVMEQMKPWRASPLVRGAVQVLECYPGTIREFGIVSGQRLNLDTGTADGE